jgi:hypothetical protein
LDAICEDLRKREKASGQPTVSLPLKRITKKQAVTSDPRGLVLDGAQ